MNALYKIQTDYQKQISAAYPNFKKKGAAKMTIITAQARLAGLEKNFAQFEATHQRILSIPDMPEDHEYFTSNLHEQVIDIFYDQKGEFLQFIEDTRQLERERNPPSPPPVDQNVTINPAHIESHSLPKMNLPKFSGKFTEWENFRNLFRSIVHRRNDLDASIKYYHLRSNLTGEALDHIKSIPIAADQYDHAWQTLISYYDNKRRAITTLINTFMNIKPMKAETDTELKRIYREVFSSIESLRKLGRSDADIGNDLLVFIAVELLDLNTKREWKKSIDKSNDTPPSLAQLKTFISGQIENLDEGKESLGTSSKNKTPKHKQASGNSESVTGQSLQTLSKDSEKQSPTKVAACSFCNAEHFISKCEQFAKKAVSDRREFAKSKHLCFNCLGSSHPQNRCKSKYSCFICKKKHNTLLHLDDSNNERASSTIAQTPSNSSQANSNATATIESSSVHSATQTTENAGILLATAFISVIGPENRRMNVTALIDPCSQVSLVTKNLCDQLSLPLEHTNRVIQGVGEQSSLPANRLASLSIKPYFNSSFLLETKALVLQQISSYKPPVVRSVTSIKFLDGLQLADPHYLEQHQVEVLLGAEVYSNIIEQKIVRGPNQQPMALQSKLGWLLTGKITSTTFIPDSHSQILTVLHTASVSNLELSEQLQEFWRAEEVPGTKNSYSQEEQTCEDLYVNTTTRNENGRYTVRLPWKDPGALSRLKLGSSYPHALSALKRLEANFQNDEKLKIEYTKFIQEYIDLGHMTAIDSTL